MRLQSASAQIFSKGLGQCEHIKQICSIAIFGIFSMILFKNEISDNKN